MKKFTDTQKKWALTATMIAALGCSISFNPHTNGFAALDMASESDHKLIQVPTSKGMLDVHLIAAGDKTTAVPSPVKDAEGKATFECKSCVTMLLDKKITEDITVLQVAVMDKLVNPAAAKKEEKVVKEASDTRKERKTSRRDRRDRDDDDIRSVVDDEEADLVDYIDEACGTKTTERKKVGRSERRSAKRSGKSVSCVSNAFLDYVNDPEVEISESVATKFYKDRLEKKILAQITSGARDQDADSLVESNEGFKIIDVLLGELPDDMNTLRKRIVLTSTKAVALSALEARQLLTTAAQTRSQDAFRSAVDKLNETNLLAEELRKVNQDGLYNLSVGEDNILSMSAANSIYNSAFGRPWDTMKLGIKNAVPAQAFTNPNAINVNAFQIPNIDLSSSGVAQFNNMNGVLVAPGYDNNNSGANWGNNGGVNNNNGQGVLIAPQQLQQNTSNGTQFGQSRMASPEALRASQQIRSQQGQAIWVQQ